MDDLTAAGADERRDLLHALAELGRIVVGVEAPHQTLHRIAELAQQTLDGVEDVPLTVIEDRRPRSVVFTGPLAADWTSGSTRPRSGRVLTRL
jgi:hypothetical protein